MKSVYKRISLLVLGILFLETNLIMFGENRNIDILDIMDNDEILNNKRLKESGSWNLNHIHINNNWSIAASTFAWIQQGDGSWNNPYIIENVTVNAEETGNGILIENSRDFFIIRNSKIFNSEISAAYAGVRFINTSNGVLANNNLSDNGFKGIYLSNNCDNNSIINNIIYSVTGIHMIGIDVGSGSDNNLILNNDLGGNFISIYMGSSHNNTIMNNSIKDSWLGGIWIESSCTYNKIIKNLIIDTPAIGAPQYGIMLQHGISNNLIKGNVISDNSNKGLQLNDGCNNNTITENIFRNNNDVDLFNSQYNLLYKNAFLGTSSIHASDNWGTNDWNSLTIGNYWDNFTAPDIDDDGIVDIPYTLINGPVNDSLPISGNPFFNGSIVHIDDSGASGHDWSWTNTRFWSTGSGTYSDPYLIEDLKINASDSNSGITIENSDKYFVLKNCTVFSSNGTGIKLNNVTNGIIINSNSSMNNLGGISLNQSNNNSISYNTIVSAQNGILLDTSHDNKIIENVVKDSTDSGIILSFSNNSVISRNLIKSSSNIGVLLQSSQDSIIYENSFESNGIHARDNGQNNQWDFNFIGNYWDNYTGVDANDDGIGDSSYKVFGSAGSHDNFPIWDDGEDIAPRITILAPNPNQIFGNPAPDFNILITELNLHSTWYSIWNGSVLTTNKTFSYGIDTIIDQAFWDQVGNGTVLITFYANDTNGNLNWTEVTVRKDINAPSITINSPTANELFGSTAPGFNVTITDPSGVNTMWYTLDGGLTNYTINLLTGILDQDAWVSLEEGFVIIKFSANDTLGNIGYAHVTVVLNLPSSSSNSVPFGHLFLAFLLLSIIFLVPYTIRKDRIRKL